MDVSNKGLDPSSETQVEESSTRDVTADESLEGRGIKFGLTIRVDEISDCCARLMQNQ